MPRSTDRGDCCGSRSSGAARVSTRAAAPYARQTRWLQRACAVYWCGASSRDAGPPAAGVRGPLGEGRRWCAACRSRRGAVGLNAKHAWTTQLLQPFTRKTLRALNRGKICAPCMIRGVSAAKRAPPWQDMRVVYPPAAICGAFRIHGARILPKPARFGRMAAICCQGGALFPSEAPSGMHEAKNLPRMAAREHIASIFCHGKALGNAQRQHIATTRRPERISRASCHR